jgi:hypothetical protein
MPDLSQTQEDRRLQEARERQVPWLKWGPYLSERQWGTGREDYRASGEAWDYFIQDQARFPSAGGKTAWPGAPMTNRASARPWPWGTAGTR